MGQDGKVSYCCSMVSLLLISRALLQVFSIPLVQALSVSRPFCVPASLPLCALTPDPAYIQMPGRLLTLLGVRRHFLHELDEIFQELGVVV